MILRQIVLIQEIVTNGSENLRIVRCKGALRHGPIGHGLVAPGPFKKRLVLELAFFVGSLLLLQQLFELLAVLDKQGNYLFQLLRVNLFLRKRDLNILIKKECKNVS